jgi:hypothetical protein
MKIFAVGQAVYISTSLDTPKESQTTQRVHRPLFSLIGQSFGVWWPALTGPEGSLAQPAVISCTLRVQCTRRSRVNRTRLRRRDEPGASRGVIGSTDATALTAHKG